MTQGHWTPRVSRRIPPGDWPQMTRLPIETQTPEAEEPTTPLSRAGQRGDIDNLIHNPNIAFSRLVSIPTPPTIPVQAGTPKFETRYI